MGMGVALPTLNLAIQNEFEQRQLGVATSSSQLFRSLGSTLGTAIFGSLLTAGIVSSIGDIQSSAYIQSLKTSPAISKIGDINDANTILTLNTPSVKKQITAGADASFMNLPAPIAKVAKDKFTDNQNNFSSRVVNAFADSLHRIFLIAAILMAGATVLIFMLKERILKTAKSSDTPGEA
jgi:hypothetical protein